MLTELFLKGVGPRPELTLEFAPRLNILTGDNGLGKTFQLFLLELENKSVTLNEMIWSKQGDAVGWLTSEVFGLKQARSQGAEIAIEAAEAWMRSDNMNEFPEYLRTAEEIHQQLMQVLPGHDPFWPRWIVKLEKN